MQVACRFAASAEEVILMALLAGGPFGEAFGEVLLGMFETAASQRGWNGARRETAKEVG